jgi:hypothetical protein
MKLGCKCLLERNTPAYFSKVKNDSLKGFAIFALASFLSSKKLETNSLQRLSTKSFSPYF